MKYRIIINLDRENEPYRLERKDDIGLWSFMRSWEYIIRYPSMEQANNALEAFAIHIKKLPKDGTVVRTFDEKDLLVYKLKNG